tara:strand:+ start:1684 stop:3807 length:2124 start_codon:yes stop_codon:yes gene_type:complete
MSRSRDIARFLGATEADNPGNLRLLALGEGTDSDNIIALIDSSYIANRSAPGVEVISAANVLPNASDNEGQIYYAQNQNRFYFSNGINWFKNELTNQDPTITVTPEGTVSLAKDGATTTTFIITGNDSTNPLTFTVDSDGDFSGLAAGALTQANDSARFVVTPKAQGSATTASATLTFNVNDGVAISSISRDLSLNFGTAGQNADGTFAPQWNNPTFNFKLHSTPAGQGTNDESFHRLKKNKAPGHIEFIAGAPWSQNSSGYNNYGNVELLTWDDNSRTWNGLWHRPSLGNGGYKVASASAIGGDYFAITTEDRYDDAVRIGKVVGAYPNRSSLSTATNWHIYNDVNSVFGSVPNSAINNDMGDVGEMDTDKEGSYWVLADTRWHSNSQSYAGALVCFNRTGSTNTWGPVVQQVIECPDVVSQARFGMSVSISSDGNWMAATAATNGSTVPRTSLRTGACYVYKRVAASGSSMWEYQQKLWPVNSGPNASKFISGNGNAFSQAMTVSMDSDAEIIAWSIPHLRPTPGMYPPGSNSNQFAVNADAGQNPGNTVYTGGVQIWKRDSDGATGSDAYSLFQELYPDSAGNRSGTENRYFGVSLDVSADGNTIIVGAPYGAAESADGTEIRSSAGVLYVYNLDSAQYSLTNKIEGDTTNTGMAGGGAVNSSNSTGSFNGALIMDNNVIVCNANNYNYSTGGADGFNWFDSGS